MTQKWRWYVYIVECKDESYYTGMTWKISTRMEQHFSGLGSKFTSGHGFKKLLYYEEFEDLECARSRELQIKGWSRKKKENLINGDWHKDWQ